MVHATNVQNREGAKLFMQKAKEILPRLELVWADGGFTVQSSDDG